MSIKKTAILVDDEPIALDRLKLLLAENSNIEILGCYSRPQTAKTAIIENKPDLLFLDVEMPGKTGLELAREIRELGIECSIVFTTGFSHYAIKAIRESAFDYLLKPVDVEELKAMLNRYEKVSPDDTKRIENLTQKFHLTERETEILKLLSVGIKSSEMAEKLNLSKHTINSHRKNLLMKMRVKSAQEVMVKYFR